MIFLRKKTTYIYIYIYIYIYTESKSIYVFQYTVIITMGFPITMVRPVVLI